MGVQVLRQAGTAIAWLLERANIIAKPRLREVVDLSWPRILTGFAIMSKQTVDLAVVGVALGSTAVAGLAVANAYWMVGKLLFIGLVGGTISLVSQNYGGEEFDRAGEVVEVSLLLTILLAVPVVVLFVGGAVPLVGLIAGNQAVTGFGATYLAIIAPGLLFEGVNLVASRTYAGVRDTMTPMVVRTGGAALNVVLSVTLVFGAGLGVAGAALGTTLSSGTGTVVFAWGLTGRSYLGHGASPIPVRFDSRPDIELLRQLLAISTPIIGRRVLEGVFIFPLLAIAATFGSSAVAAIGVARQIRDLMNSFAWGFAIAASTLVGQSLGGAEEALAEVYGREITKLSLVLYVAEAAVVILLAVPIADIFVGADDLSLTAAFVQVAALSVVALGVDASISGILQGAGDTQIPFVATVVGRYVLALPVAWLGTVTWLGVTSLLLALVVEALLPMLVNLARFETDSWKRVSRGYRPDANVDADVDD